MKKKAANSGYYGLEYITVEFVGERVPASAVEEMDRKVSEYVIEHRSPLRGVEVRFLRKTLGLSLATLGEHLGLSAPAILKWERAEHDRLAPINEVAVRVLFAELLGVRLTGKFSELMGTDKPTPHTFKKSA
jgi:DNA-binding transcriptional regulator YiaG